MGTFDRAEIEAAFAEYRHRAEDSQDTDWAAWADLFTDDALYVEHNLGTFRGKDAIRDTLLSRNALIRPP